MFPLNLRVCTTTVRLRSILGCLGKAKLRLHNMNRLVLGCLATYSQHSWSGPGDVCSVRPIPTIPRVLGRRPIDESGWFAGVRTKEGTLNQASVRRKMMTLKLWSYSAFDCYISRTMLKKGGPESEHLWRWILGGTYIHAFRYLIYVYTYTCIHGSGQSLSLLSFSRHTGTRRWRDSATAPRSTARERLLGSEDKQMSACSHRGCEKVPPIHQQ